MSPDAREWFLDGRRSFAAVLTATIHGDLHTAALIVRGLDLPELQSALSVAVGTCAANIETACAATGFSVDEYVQGLALLAEQ